jgi:hypothetical protein
LNCKCHIYWQWEISVVYYKRKRNILWNVRVFRGINRALEQQPRPIRLNLLSFTEVSRIREGPENLESEHMECSFGREWLRIREFRYAWRTGRQCDPLGFAEAASHRARSARVRRTVFVKTALAGGAGAVTPSPITMRGGLAHPPGSSDECTTTSDPSSSER